MKIPGLTIVPTKEMNRQLKRIADCLEVIVLEQYAIRMTPTPKPDKDESDVMYGDEEKYAIQEARDIGTYKDPARTVDSEEFPE